MQATKYYVGVATYFPSYTTSTQRSECSTLDPLNLHNRNLISCIWTGVDLGALGNRKSNHHSWLSRTWPSHCTDWAILAFLYWKTDSYGDGIKRTQFKKKLILSIPNPLLDFKAFLTRLTNSSVTLARSPKRGDGHWKKSSTSLLTYFATSVSKETFYHTQKYFRYSLRTWFDIWKTSFQ